MKSCGCVSPKRRRCVRCDPDRGMFLACSRECLQRHGRQRHGETVARAADADVRERIARLNQHRGGAPAYASHRDRMMRLVTAVQRGPGVCVLGAGNCDDLDLPLLAREFGQVHLVDLDGDALAAALERGAGAGRVVAHGGVDLTGLLHCIDAWGDRFPAPGELAGLAAPAAEDIAGRVGGTFDVVLSTCVLTQLPWPFKEMLLLEAREIVGLLLVLRRIHLATMAALVRPGGTGVLVTEVLTSRVAPDPFRPSPEVDDAALAADLGERVSADLLPVDPDPRNLLQLLEEPGLARLIEHARVTEPWIWHAGRTSALAYGVVFRRRDERPG